MRFLFILLGLVSILFSSVDVNTANVKEFSLLKGIGKVKAEAIVKYRKNHCFKTIDELTNIKGIGKKTIAKNRENLTISECKK